MRGALPAPLSALLEASDVRSRDEAWAAFVSCYSPLIMRVARLLDRDADAVMDRYAFALDHLRRDDCKRLRQYAADGRGEFTTWLVLVVRRLCLDEHRRRYGRRQSDDSAAVERRAARRRLADLVGLEPELAEVAAEGDTADGAVRAMELSAAVEAAILQLDTSDRLLVRLRYHDGLSVPTIARMIRAPSPAHVYRRLEHVLVLLRTNLRHAGVEDSVP